MVASAAIVGFSLGYAAAYVARLVHVAFLEAVIVGILGGSLILFTALFVQAPPRGWISVACVVLGMAGWFGLQTSDYRHTLKQLTQRGLDPGLQTLSVHEIELITTPEQRARLQNDATAIFHDALRQRTGTTGLWGFVRLRWQNGLVIMRVGTKTLRGKLPSSLVLASQVLSVLLSVLLAWMVLRRIGWALQCVSCKRYISRRGSQETSSEESSATPETVWSPHAEVEESDWTDEELAEIALTAEVQDPEPIVCPYCKTIQS
jgi:hypothetical protein